jgi:hypothetical protein
MSEMKRSGRKKGGLGQGVVIVLVILVIGGLFYAISQSHEILSWVASKLTAPETKH